ncbi:MAG: MlaD family protein [Bacteroidia bacterium]
MKISNEVKFGIFALITIALIIYGLNYMTGSQLFGPPLVLNTKYQDVNGLVAGSPIMINGLRVGKVGSLTLDMEAGLALAKLEFDTKIDIPVHAEAMIYSIDLLGSKGVKIVIPDSLQSSDNYLRNNDEITGSLEPSLLGVAGEAIQDKGVQILVQLAKLSVELNEIVRLSKVLLTDENNNSSLRATIANIKQTSDNLTSISSEVDSIAREMTGIARDAASIVNNFEQNNDNVTSIIGNVRGTTDTLVAASANIRELIADASSAVGSVESMVSKLDSTGGTLGLLLNDTQLYDSLTNTTENVNALLREIKANPQRFFDDIKIYLIERKDKGN